MRIPLKVEGFEKDTIEVEYEQIFTKPELLVNGTPAREDESGNFILTRNDGKEVKAKWKKFARSDLPNLEVGGKVYRVDSPIRLYEWLLMILPLVLQS